MSDDPYFIHGYDDMTPDEWFAYISGGSSELSDRERAIVARFDAAEPAPESYVRQHRMSPTCLCGPTLAPGTKFGVLMHRKPEES